jgi:UDP-N-acetyl-2-amino-2-deoxyglucuronate dehydrogenase
MAISLTSFERQFQDFGNAILQHHDPLITGEEGYRALEVVLGIYAACRRGGRVEFGN